MKSMMKKLIAVSLCVVTISLVFSSCYYVKRTPELPENTITYSSDYQALGDGSMNKNVKLSKGEYADVEFDGEVTFDTVTLYESGDNCDEFNIYIDKDGEWELVYKQDRIMA